MIISKNWKFFSYIKFGIENGEKVCRKIEINWVENTLGGGWKDGWVDGSQSRVKDCLQQSKICEFSLVTLGPECIQQSNGWQNSPYP